MFSFTFRQTVKKKGYSVVTVIVSMLLLAGVALAVVLTAKPEGEGKGESKPSAVRDVYVISEYDTDFGMLLSALGKESYAQTEFHAAESREEAISGANAAGQKAYLLTELRYEDGAFRLEAILPEGTEISKSEAEDLLAALAECFDYARVGMVGLTQEQAAAILTPIAADCGKIGEDKSLGAQIVKRIIPMLCGLVIYMMLIFYGQEVSREISVEKTSKLTETLLTSVRPYAMITGKVLAIALSAILQFFLWILFAVAGLLIGNVIAKSMYTGYENAILKMLDFLRGNFGESAFTPAAIVIAVLIFVLGFLFYCVLAGMAGSIVSKPEDTAQAQGIFQFPVIISFFACYFGAILEKTGLITATRFIPFTIPFGIPADLLTGSASIVQGLISLAILAVFTVLVIILSGRLYEGLILYNGQRLTPKTMVNIMRAKRM